MRISNYPSDVLTGSELILGTDVDTSTQTYKTVNFSVDTLKAFFDAGDAGGVTSIVFEGTTDDNYDGILTSVASGDPSKTYTLPNATGYVALFEADPGSSLITSTPTELNLLDNVSGLVQADFTKLAAVDATAAELNLLDGVTATTTELNYVDGVTSNIQTQLDAKLVASNLTNYLDKTSTASQYLQGHYAITGFPLHLTATPASAAAGDLILSHDVDISGSVVKTIAWNNAKTQGTSDNGIGKIICLTSSTGSSENWGGRLQFQTRQKASANYNTWNFDSDGMLTVPSDITIPTDKAIITSGNLLIKGSSETLAKFTDNGSCELYHDNVKAVETVGATHVKGIKITGGIKMGSTVTSPSLVDLDDGSAKSVTMHEEAGAIGFLAPDAGLADGAKSAEITFTNLRIESGGAIVAATCNGAGDGAVIPIIYRTAAGSCRIKLWNQSGGTIANGTQILVNFAVINVNS